MIDEFRTWNDSNEQDSFHMLEVGTDESKGSDKSDNSFSLNFKSLGCFLRKLEGILQKGIVATIFHVMR